MGGGGGGEERGVNRRRGKVGGVSQKNKAEKPYINNYELIHAFSNYNIQNLYACHAKMKSGFLVGKTYLVRRTDKIGGD